ncbi:hypothetical protein NDU88_001507 [Pleurodeles waltl]|uniref:Uncharacterized protein n=1 Tax=Pleurodeles waltl TaxID=8319 RepID=A0AAV7T0C6_PLEWA|nr:hypothetical protein NDU88_001507 [Pleurodeles waltl]
MVMRARVHTCQKCKHSSNRRLQLVQIQRSTLLHVAKQPEKTMREKLSIYSNTCAELNKHNASFVAKRPNTRPSSLHPNLQHHQLSSTECCPAEEDTKSHG